MLCVVDDTACSEKTHYFVQTSVSEKMEKEE